MPGETNDNLEKGTCFESQDSNQRKDYTNLREIYLLKLVCYIGLAFLVVLQAQGDIHLMLVGSFVYLMTLLFDFIVISKLNKGPKQKTLVMFCKSAMWICIVILVFILVVILGDGEKYFESYGKELNLFLATSILCLGALGPFTELKLNKPNDD